MLNKILMLIAMFLSTGCAGLNLQIPLLESDPWKSYPAGLVQIDGGPAFVVEVPSTGLDMLARTQCKNRATFELAQALGWCEESNERVFCKVGHIHDRAVDVVYSYEGVKFSGRCMAKQGVTVAWAKHLK